MTGTLCGALLIALGLALFAFMWRMAHREHKWYDGRWSEFWSRDDE